MIRVTECSRTDNQEAWPRKCEVKNFEDEADIKAEARLAAVSWRADVTNNL